jgi:hypothetical protein
MGIIIEDSKEEKTFVFDTTDIEEFIKTQLNILLEISKC